VNILVTAGNTVVPVDKVRCLTNIFTGATGALIALAAHRRGHNVLLLTSHPNVLVELKPDDQPLTERWCVYPYRTFDDLQMLMANQISQQWPETVIHCAAVSDYRAAGVYMPDGHTHFDESRQRWQTDTPDEVPGLIDVAADKIKSDAPELWLRLVRTPKLIDLVRAAWKFRGVLVKFKLEAGITEERLLEIAEQSRCQSGADLMVANRLEDRDLWAHVGPVNGAYQRIKRGKLANQLVDEVERLRRERRHG
jgi:phosphopantothenoylcysteine synthetase/decarboxylase